MIMFVCDWFWGHKLSKGLELEVQNFWKGVKGGRLSEETRAFLETALIMSLSKDASELGRNGTSLAARSRVARSQGGRKDGTLARLASNHPLI